MRLALVAGPAWCALTWLAPAPFGLPDAAWHVAGVAGWMAVWWLTAVVDLEATALLPIVLLPLAGIAPIGGVTASYADPIIFLFMGGFFLAATLERWGLHRRFALATVRAVGTDAPRVVLAFMLASAFVSMWISNTATAVMMLPIATALVSASDSGRRPQEGGTADGAPPANGPPNGGFQTALLLAVAYGASIGGVATLIGTPPNAILAGAARELLGEEVTFAGWMAIALPVAVPMLAGCWWLLVRRFGIRGALPGLAEELDRERAGMGSMSGGERFVVAVFVLTALAWVFSAPKQIGGVRIPGLADVLPGLSDAGIAVTASVVLFIVPLAGQRFRTALDWETARRVPWGILLLFGGGLALAGAFESSGLTDWLGSRLATLAGSPEIVVLAATATLFVFLTELTSNTATAALGMPLMVGVAAGLGLAPLPLMTTAALAASMAFMLPVATPPNAVIFGSGLVDSKDMARAGLRLNFLSITIVTLAMAVYGR